MAAAGMIVMVLACGGEGSVGVGRGWRGRGRGLMRNPPRQESGLWGGATTAPRSAEAAAAVVVAAVSFIRRVSRIAI